MAEETVYEWRALSGKMNTASEAELYEMLREEQLGKARVSFLLRIYARYAIVRGRRERSELLTPTGLREDIVGGKVAVQLETIGDFKLEGIETLAKLDKPLKKGKSNGRKVR